jgi:hypothetical protein
MPVRRREACGVNAACHQLLMLGNMKGTRSWWAPEWYGIGGVSAPPKPPAAAALLPGSLEFKRATTLGVLLDLDSF